MNFSQEKRNGNFSWWLKISDKKPLVCHGHFLLCHGQNCRNRHGHFSFFTGIFLAILSRATRSFSRAKLGVFCHGNFFKKTGTFSESVTGKAKIVTGKEKNTGLNMCKYWSTELTFSAQKWNIGLQKPTFWCIFNFKGR